MSGFWGVWMLESWRFGCKGFSRVLRLVGFRVLGPFSLVGLRVLVAFKQFGFKVSREQELRVLGCLGSSVKGFMVGFRVLGSGGGGGGFGLGLGGGVCTLGVGLRVLGFKTYFQGFSQT